MTKKLIVLLIVFLAAASCARCADRKFVICIDAGHGGKDSGAPGSFSSEKSINLNIALAFGRYIQQNCPDVRIVYTRKTDVFVPLYERAEIANRNKADLFISIHTNALKNDRSTRGFETYTLGDGKSHGRQENLEVAKRENSVILLENDYRQHYVGFDPNSPESNIMFEFIQDHNLHKSIDLAKMLQKHVCRTAGRPDKGVHQENLAVLRLTSMPACLTEVGYISTPSEERLLNQQSQVDKIARGMYNAFVEYKNTYDSQAAQAYKPLPAPTADSPEETTPQHDSPQSQAQAARPQHTKPRKPAADTPAQKPRKKANAASGRPVFKIQILSGTNLLKDGDRSFKGLRGIEHYREGNMIRYTYGASEDYNKIYRLRKEILQKFPEAFIIAFKNGQKTDVNEAIREFKQNRR